MTTDGNVGIGDRYIRWSEVKTIIPLSRSRVEVLEKQGKFPKRRRIGGAAVAWLESELRCWMASRDEAGAARPASATTSAAA